ncbi:T9SS type A sorting domain-containing protein [Spirosoma aureum]|uniref:T9SS type A sorting domain-containing protein n=1 Tax=Spirosoma aureum TaxID=2692134 RepID=A0A6G9AV37_9BACT|nr:putative Ig domain-containing protein [Spirosoma aureum]QIP16073.1 T9SS type A sorting domain-containing protein [Spirosoma aureum]
MVSSLSSQTATAGTYFTYVIPEGTFTDTETPLSLRLSASGLPAGLGFVGATLSGIPSTTVGSPFTVSITATDPGGLSVSTPLLLTVLPATTTPPPTQPFAITGVTTISCTPVADRININFAPRYAGLTGQSIAFEVVNELAPTTDPAPYSLTLYRDNPVLSLKATQTGSVEVASFSYNWLAACASAGQDNTPPRLNSPVGNQTAVVGQGYSLNLANTFADQETPNQITLVASGLPAGLSLVGTQLSGTPNGSGVSTVVLTATDPGSLSASTSFDLTVLPAVVGPLTVNLTATPSQLVTSGSTTLTASVSGGTGPYSYVFTGPGSINPGGNSATVSGLSAGVQTFRVVVSDATSPVSQTVAGTVSVTVSEPSNPPSGFSITGVNTVSCEVLSVGQRRLSFTPIYAGVSGQPISFSVVNELPATTNAGPYSLNLYTDNPSITLKATQSGSAGEASYVYNWLAVCSTGARVGVEAVAPLVVEVLGNPVVSDRADVLIKGSGNQEVKLRVVDGQGNVVSERTVGSSELSQPQAVELGQPAGQYILQVSTPAQRQTVKILKR